MQEPRKKIVVLERNSKAEDQTEHRRRPKACGKRFSKFPSRDLMRRLEL